MAVQPIDQRLNAMNESAADFVQREKQAAQSVEQVGLLPEQQVNDAVNEDDESYQVAVLGSLGRLRTFSKKASEALKEVEVRKPARPKVSDEVKVEMEVEDVIRSGEMSGAGTPEQLGISGRIEQGKSEKITPSAIAQKREEVLATTDITKAKPPEAAFNMPRMGTTEEVSATIEAIYRLDPTPPQRITFDEVKKLAAEQGIGVKFLDDLTRGELEIDPVNTYKALQSIKWSGEKLTKLSQKAAEGVATATELAEMVQTANFHHVLQRQVMGYRAKVAQSLAVMRMDRGDTKDLGLILSHFGNGQEDYTRFAQVYLAAKDPHTKAKLISEMAEGSVWSRLFGVYVNGLLARPGTQLRNFGSNTVFVPYRMVERELAAGIGAVRYKLGIGTADRYMLSEVPTMLGASNEAVRNGWRLAADAWREGVPRNWSDPVKISRQHMKMELFKYRGDNSLLEAGMKGLNYITTTPGRALMTADEFFKGINYSYEFAAEASRIQILTFEDAIRAGSSVDEAMKLADDALTRYTMEPPDHLMELSEVGTFTQQLQGSALKIQNQLNPTSFASFVARTQLPFIATPINLTSAAVERTPLGLIPEVKKVIQAIRGKGDGTWTKDTDMAIAKVGLGSAVMYNVSQMANMGQITGPGPGERGLREAMVRQGWQPYSFVVDRNQFSEGFQNTFPGLARFGSGDYEGKVFISYQGFEPVGMLVAMGAAYSDYARYETNKGKLEAVVTGYAYGMSRYLLDHPFIQGIDNFFDMAGAFISEEPGKFERGINKLTEIMATTARKSVQPLSGLTISARQAVDPMIRDYKGDVDLPVGLQGVHESVMRFMNETPGFSETLEPRLNIWAGAAEHDYAWSPLRMRQGKTKPVDAGLIQLGMNVGRPSDTITVTEPRTGVSGVKVKLNTKQYNDLLKIANFEMGLEAEMSQLVEYYLDNPFKYPPHVMQDTVSNTFSRFFGAARQEMIARDPELQEKAYEHAKRILQAGRGVK